MTSRIKLHTCVCYLVYYFQVKSQEDDYEKLTISAVNLGIVQNVETITISSRLGVLET